MTTFSMFGICLLVWLLVGLYVGIKVVYVEDKMSLVKQDEIKQKFKDDTGFDIINDPMLAKAWNIVTHKPSAVAIFTLLGFVAMYLHIQSKVKSIKNFFTKKRGK